MLKNLQNDILLWVQAKTGLSSGFVISLAVAGSVALLAFIVLCVTGYVCLSIELGPVFGGLAMAGVFLLIGVLSAAASALARDRTRQRAIVEPGTNRRRSRPSDLHNTSTVERRAAIRPFFLATARVGSG